MDKKLRTTLTSAAAAAVIAAVAASATPSVCAAVPYEGQTEAGEYEISTPAQLRSLGTAAQGCSFSNATFTQTADIDLSGEDWTPIGNDSTPFAGTFHGNGRKITGLRIDSGGDYAGLFGVVSNAVLDGVTLDGASIVKDGV